MNVREYYHQALEERGYLPDEAQLAAVDRLQAYYDDWVLYLQARSSPLRKLFLSDLMFPAVCIYGEASVGAKAF